MCRSWFWKEGGSVVFFLTLYWTGRMMGIVALKIKNRGEKTTEAEFQTEPFITVIFEFVKFELVCHRDKNTADSSLCL